MPISLPAASATPEITLRVDDSGTPFGDTPTWSDYSSALETAGDGQPISITRGRQDGQGEPQPATCTFVLDNTSGAYTPGNAAAAAGWDVGARVNVRLAVGGTTYDRFDGYVDSVEPSYPGMDWSQVTVVASDVTARLAIGQPLKSMVEQEILLDNPIALWPMDEPSDSHAAGDRMGTASTLIAADSKYGGGTMEFGADGVTPETTSARFAHAGAVNDNQLTVLRGNAADVPTAPPYTVEFWFVIDTMNDNGSALPIYENLLMAIGNGTDELLRFGVGDSHNFFPGKLMLTPADGTGGGGQSTSRVDDLAWHVVGYTVAADGVTCKTYVDGVLEDTNVASVAQTMAPTWFHVGGRMFGLPYSGPPFDPFDGRMAFLAFYDTELSAARLLSHYQAGSMTFTESTDARYERLASYAGVTTGSLPSGVAVVGHQDTMGKNITEALQQVARSEGSVSYATGSGELMFQGREARYNATTGLALTSADVNVDLTTRRDKQGMANEFTVTRAGGATQRVVDQAAQLADGRYDGGSLDVVVSTDADARHIAEWEVATRKTPRSRMPSLTVDLLTLADAVLVEEILAADLSTLITVTDLPDQAPDTDMSVFLEGWTETIGVTQWSLTAFTSPDLPQVQTVDDGVGGTDPTAVLDGTFLVAL